MQKTFLITECAIKEQRIFLTVRLYSIWSDSEDISQQRKGNVENKYCSINFGSLVGCHFVSVIYINKS